MTNERERAELQLDEAVRRRLDADEFLEDSMRAARQHMSANAVAARVAPVMSRPVALRVVRPATPANGE